MGKIRQFVLDSIAKVNKSTVDNRKSESLLDIGEDSVCSIDGTTEDLLKCLAKNMKEFDEEMMVCVPAEDLNKSDASLRAIARKHGVSLKVNRKVVVGGVNDAVCLRLTKDDRKMLLKKLT